LKVLWFDYAKMNIIGFENKPLLFCGKRKRCWRDWNISIYQMRICCSF